MQHCMIGFTHSTVCLAMHVALYSLAIALYDWLYTQCIVCFHVKACTYARPSQLIAHHIRPITHFSLVFSVGMYGAI